MGIGWFLIGHAIASQNNDSRDRTPYKTIKVEREYTRDKFIFQATALILGWLTLFGLFIWCLPTMNSVILDVSPESAFIYKVIIYPVPVFTLIGLILYLTMKKEMIGENERQ